MADDVDNAGLSIESQDTGYKIVDNAGRSIEPVSISTTRK